MYTILYNTFLKGGNNIKHNKVYALKLIQDKQNGINNYSYSQIGLLTGYTKTQIYRLNIEITKKDIDSIKVHGLTNKPSNNSPSRKEIEFIKNFKNQYPVISISQFMDIYHEDIIFNIKMHDTVKKYNLKKRSYSFFENLYKKEHWISPINHKEFKKNYIIHPLREPSPKRGILIMIDGTPHDWFQNGNKFSLHLAIDDATGEILCGWFMKNECLEGYVMLLKLLVEKHGIPENIYSDRHSILIAIKDGNTTQFGHMCNDLGINQIAALSPEAKGKVERMNQTLQNRLINDIKRYNIKTYSELNEWFNSYYIKYINKKFAYKPKNKDKAFVKLCKTNLEYILCTRDERTMLDGCVFSYKGHYYSVILKDNEIKQIYKGTKIKIYENVLNHKIFAKYYDKFYNTKLIQDKISRSEKIKITKIENQKILEQVLRERDEKLKARANKVSSS
jgi:hypothetical protein